MPPSLQCRKRQNDHEKIDHEENIKENYKKMLWVVGTWATEYSLDSTKSTFYNFLNKEVTRLCHPS